MPVPQLMRGSASGRFAHLFGGKKARAEDQKPEDDKKPEAEGEDPETEDDKKPEAENEPKTPEAADEETPDAEEDDTDPDKEMRGNSPAAAARRRERARCAAIFADPAAAHNPALAASLAFETTLPRQEALAILRTGAAAAPRGGLNGRMQGQPQPAIKPDAQPLQGRAAVEAFWDDIRKNASGRR